MKIFRLSHISQRFRYIISMVMNMCVFKEIHPQKLVILRGFSSLQVVENAPSLELHIRRTNETAVIFL